MELVVRNTWIAVGVAALAIAGVVAARPADARPISGGYSYGQSYNKQTSYNYGYQKQQNYKPQPKQQHYQRQGYRKPMPKRRHNRGRRYNMPTKSYGYMQPMKYSWDWGSPFAQTGFTQNWKTSYGYGGNMYGNMRY